MRAEQEAQAKAQAEALAKAEEERKEAERREKEQKLLRMTQRNPSHAPLPGVRPSLFVQTKRTHTHTHTHTLFLPTDTKVRCWTHSL